MKKEIRMQLLAESLGYWRGAGQTDAEGNARSATMLMALATAYARNGVVGFNTMVGLTNCSLRYQQAILETVKELLGE